jgi:5-methylcytosine-specific restriction endonuclease McrA
VRNIQKFFDYTDKGILFICFVINRKLHVHHIIPIKMGGNNTLDNLITLCEDCHKKEHSHIENIKRKHILLDRWSC